MITVEDWDLFEKMMNHIYKKHVKSDSALHPVLLSEAPVIMMIYMSYD